MVFAKLKDNIRGQASNLARIFPFKGIGSIELMPGVPKELVAAELEFMIKEHTRIVEFVDADGNLVEVLDKDGNIKADILEAAEPKVKEIDFGGEVVKPKKLKTNAPQGEVNKLIFGE